MATRCWGCMQQKENRPVCEHCGFDERVHNKAHQLPVGTLVGDQYILGKVLGQGGFGITYIGWDKVLNQRVAVKEYFPSGYAGRDTRTTREVTSYDGQNTHSFEDNKRRFLREAESLAKLWNIPQIVRILRHFEENGTAYIAMEYAEGEDLRKYVKRLGRPMTMEEVLDILGPIMEALTHVHGAELVHRDISPDNIMVLSDGTGKLLDFGAARYVENADAGRDRNTSTQAILKHGFAPPEQYRSHGALGPWTDIYAMCATVYYCLSGKIPPESMSRMMGEAELELDGIPGLTARQRKALEAGMTLIPKQRTKTASELHQALFGEILAAREAEKRKERERKAEEKRRAEEALRKEQARKAEEARRAEEALRKEQERKAAKKRRAEEALRKEQERKAEEARRAEEALRKEQERKAEEARRAEEALRKEQERKAEEARRAEEALRKEQERKLREEQRAAEKRRKEQAQKEAALAREEAEEKKRQAQLEQRQRRKQKSAQEKQKDTGGFPAKKLLPVAAAVVLAVGIAATFLGKPSQDVQQTTEPAAAAVTVEATVHAQATAVEIAPELALEAETLGITDTITVLSEHAPEQLSWSSSDPNVVTVSQDGTLTVTGYGAAEVRASLEDSSAVCRVVVYPKANIVCDYEENETGLTITYYSGPLYEEIILPRSIDGKPVTAIEDYAFCGHPEITSVVIPEGIQTIGNNAFWQCKNLEKVSIPGSVTCIAENAFAETKWLDACEEPFLICGDGILLSYNGVDSHAVIPDTVKMIGPDAFADCKTLESLEIPDTVEVICKRAFSGCSNLMKLVIPDTVREIESHAFQDTAWLAAQKDDFVIVGDGVLILYNGGESNVTIPEGVKYISSAFYQCFAVQEVTVPEGVEYIGMEAFHSCFELKKVNLPKSLIEIGQHAFDNCSRLPEITIPEGVTRIGRSAFANCYELKTVSIESDLIEITDFAFQCCYALQNIVIPESVSRIGYYAFSFCSALRSVTISENCVLSDAAFPNTCTVQYY